MDAYYLSRRGLMRAAASAAAFPLLARAEESEKTISYVRAVSASDIDAHADFGWEVLSAVLERTRPTHGDYTLTISPDPAQALRFRHATTSSEVQVNTVILTISPDWNDVLLPVRIPLLRGLLGYRLLLVHRDNLERCGKVKTLEDLRHVTFGSVQHWMDTTIMERAGLPVVTGTTFDGLYKMMQARRFETLTRGVHQIEAEMAKIAASDPSGDIVVEPHLLLHYYLPVYFWFSRDSEGQRRAARVKAGLSAMVADASLEKMFDAKYGPVIRKYDLAHRTVIDLPNPLLSPDDPVNDPRYWYRPKG